jgi:hypothetical protein
VIQKEMREEKRTLINFNYTFEKLSRDRDKHAKILNERKLRQDELERLKTEYNKIKKDGRSIVISDRQLIDMNSEVEQAQSQLD